MTCQEIISAALDGEATALPVSTTHEHLANCPACREFADTATTLHRFVRVAPATPVPDLTARILAATAEDAPVRSRRQTVLRVIVAAVALIELGYAIPALLFGDGPGAPMHAARHLGAFDLGLAVGFAWVALRPRNTLSGFLPIATALVVACVSASIIDIVHGESMLIHEINHAAAIVGLAGAWLLGAREHRPHRTDRQLRLAA